MGVLTITLNPAIDKTMKLSKLIPGTVHRAQSVTVNAGGKGINVSSLLSDWGIASNCAAGFLGCENTRIFEELFLQKHIEDAFIRVAGETRTNIKIVDDNHTTDLNEPGVSPSAEDITRLEEAAAAFLREREKPFVLLSGSLPPSCPPDIYKNLIIQSMKRNARVLLDTSGEPLTQSLNSSILPYCIKPNIAEFSQWAGKEFTSFAGVIDTVRPLFGRGLGLAVISMGEDGALFITPETTLHAKGCAEHVASTAGAGDAMTAGIIAALACGMDLIQIARLATAFALVKLAVIGPNLPEHAPRESVEAIAKTVQIEKII